MVIVHNTQKFCFRTRMKHKKNRWSYKKIEKLIENQLFSYSIKLGKLKNDTAGTWPSKIPSNLTIIAYSSVGAAELQLSFPKLSFH